MSAIISAVLALTMNSALAGGCWEAVATNPTVPGQIAVGDEEIVTGDTVCEVGSVDGATYRAGCISESGDISFVAITEGDDTATVIWDEGKPEAYRRCD